jgi:UDP-glucose 4-epimerase
MKQTILVTGGTGYIGSHTIVDLQENGYNVICVDNQSRSQIEILNNIESITSIKPISYSVDLVDYKALEQVFVNHPNIDGIIHFAAYKAVGESVQLPLMYYENNMFGLINLLKCVEKFNIPNFVFSSSCTVYGNPKESRVTEQTPKQPAASPYGATKQMGETIITDFSVAQKNKNILLRYFNPVGAHPSNLLGETTTDKPQNLVPAITKTAIGKMPQMTVFGNDYDTRDGSCVRDFIHVCDIAHAHTLAIKYLLDGKLQENVIAFNLGTGNGITVIEAIKTFEEVSGTKLNYVLGDRRPGDVVSIYANNDFVKQELGWDPKLGLKDMMHTAWQWELKQNNQ